MLPSFTTSVPVIRPMRWNHVRKAVAIKNMVNGLTAQLMKRVSNTGFSAGLHHAREINFHHDGIHHEEQADGDGDGNHGGAVHKDGHAIQGSGQVRRNFPSTMPPAMHSPTHRVR